MVRTQTQTLPSDIKAKVETSAQHQLQENEKATSKPIPAEVKQQLSLHYATLFKLKGEYENTWRIIQNKYRQVGLQVPEHVQKIALDLGMTGSGGILEFIYQIQGRFGTAYAVKDPECSLKPDELNDLVNAIRYPENYSLSSLPVRHMRKSFLGFIFDAIKVTVILQSFMRILEQLDPKDLTEKTDISNVADVTVWYPIVKDLTTVFPLRQLTVSVYRTFVNKKAASQFDPVFVENQRQLILGTASIWDQYNDLLLSDNLRKSSNLTAAFNVMSGLVNEIEQKGLGEFVKDKFFKVVKSTTEFFTGDNEQDAQEAYEETFNWMLAYGYNEIASTQNEWMIDDYFDMFKRYIKLGANRITNALGQTNSPKDLIALEKLKENMRTTQAELANWITEYIANYKKLATAVRASEVASLSLLGRTLDNDGVKNYLNNPSNVPVRTMTTLSNRLFKYKTQLNELYKSSVDLYNSFS